ncbi:MAG: SpoIIE family protein phosphatase [Eubacterium sp.]|nr:SpoIIE family protein phosphatase [Eubacterium sp.]
MKDEKSKKKKTVSLRKKSVSVVLLATVVISLITVSVSGIFYTKHIFEHYKRLSEQLADTAASMMSAEDISRYYTEVKKITPYDDDKYNNDEAYREAYDKQANALKDEKYQQMLETLFVFADESKGRNDIEYIYVQVIEGNQVTYIFDADHTDEQYQLGTVRPVSDENRNKGGLENGIPAFVSNNPDDGWLCSCMRPIKDAKGKPVALVGVDISMSRVVYLGIIYIVTLIAIVLFISCLLIFLILRGVEKSLVKPINQLSSAARSFVEDKGEELNKESTISTLNINTGDEVETLWKSIRHMEQDINDYIVHLTAVTAEKERIGAELGLATRLQADMLPNIFPAFPDRKDLDIFAMMTPAKEVGGDFYDFFLVDNKHLAMVMADVSGKGVPAALFMMMSRILIKNAVMSGNTPADALMSVNNQICANNREEMFVTVWLGIVDLKTGLLSAANAGHEKPIVKSPNGDFEVVNDRHGFVIGGMEGLKYRNYDIQLQKGSKLFLYTDGVAEATDANDELYGIERTLDALNSCKDEKPKAILEAVKASVDSFVGDAPQFDDLTMLCFEFEGEENELTIDAKLENVEKAIDFVAEKVGKMPFSLKEKNRIEIAVDEIVSNVARYAYGDGVGEVNIRVESDDEGMTLTVTDSGIPYNPLEKEDPDLTLSADERGIGGYGIFIVKNTMDKIDYEYSDGKNILIIRENFKK